MKKIPARFLVLVILLFSGLALLGVRYSVRQALAGLKEKAAMYVSDNSGFILDYEKIRLNIFSFLELKDISVLHLGLSYQ